MVTGILHPAGFSINDLHQGCLRFHCPTTRSILGYFAVENINHGLQFRIIALENMKRCLSHSMRNRIGVDFHTLASVSTRCIRPLLRPFHSALICPCLVGHVSFAWENGIHSRPAVLSGPVEEFQKFPLTAEHNAILNMLPKFQIPRGLSASTKAALDDRTFIHHLSGNEIIDADTVCVISGHERVRPASSWPVPAPLFQEIFHRRRGRWP